MQRATLFTAALLLVGGVGCGGDPAGDDPRPDVVLIMLDTLRPAAIAVRRLLRPQPLCLQEFSDASGCNPMPFTRPVWIAAVVDGQ